MLAEEGPIGEPGQGIVEGVVEKLRLQALLFGGVDQQTLGDAATTGRVVAHRVRLVVHPDDRAIGFDHPIVEAERLFRGPVFGEGGDRGRAVVRVREPRPQLRVLEKGLGRVAQDGFDLGAHVGEVPAVGDAGVRDIDVDRRRHALHEGLVARVRLGPLGEGDLQVVAGPT